jgi:hypothetical protein
MLLGQSAYFRYDPLGQKDQYFRVIEAQQFPCLDKVGKVSRGFSQLYYVNKNFQHDGNFSWNKSPVVSSAIKYSDKYDIESSIKLNDDVEVIIARKYSLKVDALYKLVAKHTGNFGGTGVSNESIYGELTIGSFQNVVNLMVEKCGLGSNSRFLDIGSGLGKPNLHLCQVMNPPIVNIGIESSSARWTVSVYATLLFEIFIFMYILIV